MLDHNSGYTRMLRSCLVQLRKGHYLAKRRPWHDSKIDTTNEPRHLQHRWRQISTTHPSSDRPISNTRNIGIIAHIDAGKTTTTERMLYYSGLTRRIGNVDEGSTVTDFLPAEKARGVTIQSAAISFVWPPPNESTRGGSHRAIGLEQHDINLIDTPGHADFTFEVVRSLRILDGAVCILDGVAGVEAQTEKVWRQASNYRIPKIVYVNKLDREGAAFANCVRQIAARLRAFPIVCQIPWWSEGGKGRFCGIGDAIGLRALLWQSDDPDGTHYRTFSLQELSDADLKFKQEIIAARIALVENLAEHDDQLVEKFLESGDPLALREGDILASLRRCVLDQSKKIVPVFAGASFRNIGVQALLDAVVRLLPSPDESPDPDVKLGTVTGSLSELNSGKMIVASHNEPKTSITKQKSHGTARAQKLDACVLAFKVVHDSRKGMLVYVRVYAGELHARSNIFNTNLQITERVPQLLKMYASESVPVSSIPAGQIGVIAGLKYARTGDTLICHSSTNGKSSPPAPYNNLQLRPIEVPPAVFFSSIEAHSRGEEREVKAALDLLIREDPSLQVSVDDESGQTLLSGMGEFHLEIASDRLVNELKAKAAMGAIQIAYRECLLRASELVEHVYERDQSSKASRISCLAMVEPQALDRDEDGKENQSFVEAHSDVSTIEEGNRITILLRQVPQTRQKHLQQQAAQQTSGNADLESAALASNKEERSPDELAASLPPQLPLSLLQKSLGNGALAALSRGINYPYRFHGVHVILTVDPEQCASGSESMASSISTIAKLATQKALNFSAQTHGTGLMEAVMKVHVTVDEEHLGLVASDLTSARGGAILALDEGDTGQQEDFSMAQPTDGELESDRPIDLRKVYAPPDPFAPAFHTSNSSPASSSQSTSSSNSFTFIPSRMPFPSPDLNSLSSSSTAARPRTILARVPLQEMVGYLKHLRSLTGGRGTFLMSADRFERVIGQREKNLIKQIRGF